MVRRYLSLPWVWSVTSFPKTRAEAACLTFLRAVDPAEANPFRMLAVQDFEGVAIEDTNHFAGQAFRCEKRK